MSTHILKETYNVHIGEAVSESGAGQTHLLNGANTKQPPKAPVLRRWASHWILQDASVAHTHICIKQPHKVPSKARTEPQSERPALREHTQSQRATKEAPTSSRGKPHGLEWEPNIQNPSR